MLQVNLTPTMIVFRDPSDEMSEMLKQRFHADFNSKGDLFIKDSPPQLYKILLQLSYDYDLEVY